MITLVKNKLFKDHNNQNMSNELFFLTNIKIFMIFLAEINYLKIIIIEIFVKNMSN